MIQNKMRSFLKWPGGKFRLLEHIHALLPARQQLIEPFVGGATVFLNTNFESYVLNDVNPDLINVYKTLQSEGKAFIKFCQTFFVKKCNTEQYYYRLREQFNTTRDFWERSALFVYLNRHGYNGLCRYSKKEQAFNVPFGYYENPYFPEAEMQYFHQKSQSVTFYCEDFSETLKRATIGSVVYCDPPYVPLTNTANFTAYHSNGFRLAEQTCLAEWSLKLSLQGIPVLISNHHTPLTQKLYKPAKIKKIQVQRLISCKGLARKKVWELLALYNVD